MGLTRRRLLQSSAAAALAPFVPSCGRQRDQAEVIVIGAGIAGLYAARLLEQQGLRVLVIEGSARVGGRLLTLNDLPGRPEAGGQSLDAMYARALALIHELGLEVYPRKAYLPGRTIHVRGHIVHSDDWPATPGNQLVDDERGILPNQLVNHYLDDNNPLQHLVEWREPGFEDYDRRSLKDELRRLGASAEAQRLSEILWDGRGLANMSALFAYRKRLVARFGRGEWYRIAGGSQRLPQAIAAELTTEIRFGQVVAGLRIDERGVEIACDDDSRYRARFALVSIPFSVLRRLHLEPQPPAEQWALMRSLPYNHITQVKLGFKRRFWEDDELPPAMISDAPYEKVFATAAEDRQLHVLNCWIDGLRAAELDAYTDAEIGARVVTEIEAARPAARSQLEVLDVTSWGKNPFARGSYHFWGPGQVQRYGAVGSQPWGPVHWIGEHTALLQQGIEGAMESAEREALAVLDRLGGAGTV